MNYESSLIFLLTPARPLPILSLTLHGRQASSSLFQHHPICMNPNATILDLVQQAAPRHAGRPVLQTPDQQFSIGEVLETSQAVAAALTGRGIQPGDRVMILATNRAEWIIAFLGILRSGAIALPVNPGLTASEIAYIVEHAEPALVFTQASLAPLTGMDASRTVLLDQREDSADGRHWRGYLGEAAQASAGRTATDANAPAVIFYTSGTSGRPKGVLLSHAAVVAVTSIAISNFGLRPGDRSIISGSLSFIYNILTNCLSCLRVGASLVLEESFHPERVARSIERNAITVFMGVPTMFTMLLDWAEGKTVDLSSVRLTLSSGQFLPWSLAERVAQRFGLTIYDFWGQTEGTPITGYLPAEENRGRPESCGRALEDCKVRIIDEHGLTLPAGETGEVLLAGPSVMLGYYRNPEATAATLRDGWVYTGDLGRLDEDGYLYIVGRKRDMIIRGGVNIYPAEIEDALYAHPAVVECAVVGMLDAIFGEQALACLVVRPGQEPDLDALREHCRSRLAQYKVPSEFRFYPELPKGPTGKILKRLLPGDDAPAGK